MDTDGDRIAWWSGDCTVNAPLLTSLEPRTTIFFHDCTFVEYPGQVHGAFSLLRELPESVRRKMVLMHHEDNIETHTAEAGGAGFRAGHARRSLGPSDRPAPRRLDGAVTVGALSARRWPGGGRRWPGVSQGGG